MHFDLDFDIDIGLVFYFNWIESNFKVHFILLKFWAAFHGKSQDETELKNCVTFRLAFTGPISTIHGSKLPQQFENICYHARNNWQNTFFLNVGPP